MQAYAVFRENRVTNSEAINLFKNIEDGDYLLDIVRVKPKSEAEHRALFFYKVNNIARTIGDNPNDLYKMFKKDCGIDTLSGLSPEIWWTIQKQFSDYVYDKLDIMI